MNVEEALGFVQTDRLDGVAFMRGKLMFYDHKVGLVSKIAPANYENENSNQSYQAGVVLAEYAWNAYLQLTFLTPLRIDPRNPDDDPDVYTGPDDPNDDGESA